MHFICHHEETPHSTGKDFMCSHWHIRGNAQLWVLVPQHRYPQPWVHGLCPSAAALVPAVQVPPHEHPEQPERPQANRPCYMAAGIHDLSHPVVVQPVNIGRNFCGEN